MKTLIVPVDFSATSQNAANYALEFAKVIKASVTLVNVCQVPVPFSEVSAPPYSLTELILDAEVRIKEMKDNLSKKTGEIVELYTEVLEGSISTELENFCKVIQPFAVVMGASGAGAMERLIYGSHSISAAKHLSWPLILVPRTVKFKNITKIGLAFDLLNVKQTLPIAEIKKIVNECNAQLHVLHVVSKKQEFEDEARKESAWLKEALDDIKPTFHFMNSSNVDETINDFSVYNQLDLLMVIPKKHGLIDRIINKSHTKKLILETQVPLMSIHE